MKGSMTMREIKFRAWNAAEKEMVYIKKTGYLGATGIIDYSVGNENNVWMQYTELKDRNGQDIYEGDILRRKSPSTGEFHFKKIEWDAENARFMAISILGRLEELLSSAIELGFVVIGNQFENPELLEETK